MVAKNLRKTRTSPDVRTIRKRSHFVKPEFTAVGDREETSTGFKISNFKGKSFETYYEVMLGTTSTNTVVHPKKDKTVRVLEGVLYVSMKKQDGVQIDEVVRSGNELALERGTVYRLATLNQPVILSVCQQAKYEVSLEIINQTEVTTLVPNNLLTAATETIQIPSRRGSKAVQQSQALNHQKMQKQRAVIEATRAQNAPEFAGTPNSINVKPSKGIFDDNGAG